MTNNQNSNSRNKNSNNKSQIHIRVANDSKQWITEKCGTNTQPPNPPKIPSIGNKIRTERHTMNNKQVEIKEDVSFIINKLKEELKRKTAECDELKKEKAEIKKHLGIDSKTILERLEELQERRDKLTDKNLSYEQALDEIEKKCCAVINGNERILYAYQIRDIINKAKDGE